jgi:NAD(P)-dependent dehydrogenase (short-subunit alcohol dehydrogenase family)
VVNLTSLGYCISPVKFEDWNFSRGTVYDPWTAYGQAKAANILFSYGLTRRLRDRKGITAVAAHPGSNLDTQLGSHLKPEDYNDIFEITKRNTGQEFLFDEPRFKSYAQIGATPLAAALDPTIAKSEDMYMQNCEVVRPRDHARDTEAVELLWALGEELVKQQFKY